MGYRYVEDQIRPLRNVDNCGEKNQGSKFGQPPAHPFSLQPEDFLSEEGKQQSAGSQLLEKRRSLGVEAYKLLAASINVPMDSSSQFPASEGPSCFLFCLDILPLLKVTALY